jgi:hypothetical protein
MYRPRIMRVAANHELFYSRYSRRFAGSLIGRRAEMLALQLGSVAAGDAEC